MKTIRGQVRQIDHKSSSLGNMPKPVKHSRVSLFVFLILVVSLGAVIYYTISNQVKTMNGIVVDKESKEVGKTYIDGTQEKEVQYILHIHNLKDKKNPKSERSFYVTKEQYEFYKFGSLMDITYTGNHIKGIK